MLSSLMMAYHRIGVDGKLSATARQHITACNNVERRKRKNNNNEV